MFTSTTTTTITTVISSKDSLPTTITNSETVEFITTDINIEKYKNEIIEFLNEVSTKNCSLSEMFYGNAKITGTKENVISVLSDFSDLETVKKSNPELF